MLGRSRVTVTNVTSARERQGDRTEHLEWHSNLSVDAAEHEVFWCGAFWAGEEGGELDTITCFLAAEALHFVSEQDVLGGRHVHGTPHVVCQELASFARGPCDATHRREGGPSAGERAKVGRRHERRRQDGGKTEGARAGIVTVWGVRPSGWAGGRSRQSARDGGRADM